MSFHTVVEVVVFIDFFHRHIRGTAAEHRIDVHIRVSLRLLDGVCHVERAVVADARIAATVDRRSVMRWYGAGQLVHAVEGVVARTSVILQQGREVTKHTLSSAEIVDRLGIEIFDELDIAVTWLGVRVCDVLIEDLFHRPLLNLTDARDNTARSVAALVTVYPHGMVGGIQREEDRLTKCVEVSLDFPLLIWLDVEDFTIDAAGGHEVIVRGARLGLCDQCTKRQSESSAM